MKTKLLTLCLALTLGLSLLVVSAQAAPVAMASRQGFRVDGKAVTAEVYNVDGSNYFKLRDIAMLLKDTPSCFSVNYDEATRTISVATGVTYLPDNSELKTGRDKSASCTPSNQSLMIDGRNVKLQAYNFGGNNFFRLRDLGEELSFYVGYDQEHNLALLDSAYYIRHTDLSEGLPVQLYYEVPVFKGESEGLRKINRAFDELEQNFISKKAPDVRAMTRESMNGGYAPTKEEPYMDRNDARVWQHGDLVSTSISYDWYMGGVADYGSSCYNFNAKTGKQLFLNDILDMPESKIKEAIVSALVANYPGVEETGVMETPMDAIRAMNIRDIDFIVKEDGTIEVIFDKYEIAAGYAGMFSIPLKDLPTKPLN